MKSSHQVDFTIETSWRCRRDHDASNVGNCGIPKHSWEWRLLRINYNNVFCSSSKFKLPDSSTTPAQANVVDHWQTQNNTNLNTATFLMGTNSSILAMGIQSGSLTQTPCMIAFGSAMLDTSKTTNSSHCSISYLLPVMTWTEIIAYHFSNPISNP